MQYILTEEEYNLLLERKNNYIKMQNSSLQELCTKIANEMPIDYGWPGKKEIKPWSCILTEPDEWYCDQCPVKKICPNPHKEWSK